MTAALPRQLIVWKILHVTTNGTPHRVRCGVRGKNVSGSWPARVPGKRPSPPAMDKWLRDEGWRWCRRCVR